MSARFGKNEFPKPPKHKDTPGPKTGPPRGKEAAPVSTNSSH